VNNFLKWSGTSIPNVLRAVTSTPAEMLGLGGVKGSLEAGADADLVIFSEEEAADGGGAVQLVVEEVWKFGARVFHKSDPFSPVYSPIDSSPVSSSPEPGFAL
jgi:N-acetylglucosamine-6-phosphate deacetylase